MRSRAERHAGEAENRIREVIPISFLNVVATPAIYRFALRLDDRLLALARRLDEALKKLGQVFQRVDAHGERRLPTARLDIGRR